MATWTDGCKPTRYSGIYRMKTGFRVRVRAVNPKNGTQKEMNREFEAITLEQAVVKQAEMREMLRSGGAQSGDRRIRYGDYATSLFERKIATGDLTSSQSRCQWELVQRRHLIPAFGDWYLDGIRRADIEEWRAAQGRRVKKGEYSPNTVNGWLRVLLTTLRHAQVDLDLEYDPARGIKPIDTSTRNTYTEEEPNALTVDELRRFMAKAREFFPQHFAMLALGFATGRRPSELRPLRHKGPTPEIQWNEGIMLVRRSETNGEVMERTKTGLRLRIPLPGDLVAILRQHVDQLPPGAMQKSDLLFPSLTGGFRSSTCLANPIMRIAKKAGIVKKLSARCMRRTFQDLGRVAQVPNLVVRAISGHATAAMQDHYSSVSGDEVRDGLAKVLFLAGLSASGDRSGDHHKNAPERSAA